MLSVGTPLPAFQTYDDTTTLVTDQSLHGKWTVLYFYPKDETPGCTLEACSFRDQYADFAALGVTVYGISGDSVQSHQLFRSHHTLPFHLLADTDHAMASAFDVWKERSIFGRKGFGMERSTYVIDPAGRIVAAFAKVTPLTHAAALLKQLSTLQETAGSQR